MDKAHTLVVQGGVTPWGTFVSFAGGQIISIAALICLTAEGRLWKLASLASNDLRVLSMLAAVGGAAGFAGSLVSSLLRARTRVGEADPERIANSWTLYSEQLCKKLSTTRNERWLFILG